MKKIKILIPMYNDWESGYKLLENIDQQIDGWETEISAIIVNDGSIEKKPKIVLGFKNLKSIKIINMKKNKGHARCIAAGLKYINENEDFDFVIPMDGDGEDRVEEIGILLCEAYEYPNTLITANRIKRSEGIFFKFCYTVHKFLTLIFTGQSIKFGNFACIPKSAVAEMILEPSLWSSFSGTLTKLFKSRKSISSIRGNRYFGPSKMSFLNLLIHSLSIISVFRIAVLKRCLIFLIVYLLLISKNISIITIIPVFFIFVMIISVIAVGNRENISELNDSLSNISNIDNIK
jgi:hypothetical protein